MGLADELVPGARVRGEQPLVGEEDDDAGGMEMVLDRDERLLEVAQEAGGVAHVRARCQSPPGQVPRRASSGIMASPPAMVDVTQVPETHCFAFPLVA